MRPSVSVIIPCRNEQATIAKVLKAILLQGYPLDRLEIIIAEGLSTDGTRDEIEKFRNTHPRSQVILVENQKQTIPAALNKAIQASKGDLIIRLDGHAIPGENYINRSVEDLEAQKGENVGGIWIIKPGRSTLIARSIAFAASNRFGVGDASYRLAAKEGPVDTIPFGAFRKELWKKIGGFNESLLTNEDYEFNARIRKQGGTVWLDPAIRSEYISRSTLKDLSRQYWRYGYWKNRMLRRFPGTLKWRQALPPFFVLFLLILVLLSIGSVYARFILLLVCGLYALVLILASRSTAINEKDLRLLFGIPIAIVTMHFSWGTGFWSSFFPAAQKKDTE
jgi:succinoglycan biosynthesis protein ExoA